MSYYDSLALKLYIKYNETVYEVSSGIIDSLILNLSSLAWNLFAFSSTILFDLNILKLNTVYIWLKEKYWLYYKLKVASANVF